MKVDANLVPKECLSCCIRRPNPAMRNHEYILWRKFGVAKNKSTLAKKRLRTQQCLSFARPSTTPGIEKRKLIEELLQVHVPRPHEMTMVRCSHTHSPKKIVNRMEWIHRLVPSPEATKESCELCMLAQIKTPQHILWTPLKEVRYPRRQKDDRIGHNNLSNFWLLHPQSNIYHWNFHRDGSLVLDDLIIQVSR